MGGAYDGRYGMEMGGSYGMGMRGWGWKMHTERYGMEMGGTGMEGAYGMEMGDERYGMGWGWKVHMGWRWEMIGTGWDGR